MDAVFRSTLAPVDKVALLALADWADDDGFRIYPSIRVAAAKASLSERSLQRVIQRHIASGVLETIEPARHHRPAQYRLHVARLPMRGDSVTPDSLTGDSVSGDSDDVQPVVRGDSQSVRGDCVSPNPSVRTVKKKKHPSGKRAPLKTEWPEDFVLTPERRAAAVRAGCRNPEAAWEGWRQRCLADATTHVRWGPAWITWLSKHGVYACPCEQRVSRFVAKRSVRDMARDIAAEWAAEEVG